MVSQDWAANAASVPIDQAGELGYTDGVQIESTIHLRPEDIRRGGDDAGIIGR